MKTGVYGLRSLWAAARDAYTPNSYFESMCCKWKECVVCVQEGKYSFLYFCLLYTSTRDFCILAYK